MICSRLLLLTLAFSSAILGCGKNSAQSLAVTEPTCNGPTDVLLYNGEGADEASWRMLETILSRNGYCYQTVNSEQMNAFSAAEINAHRMLIFPGGYGDTITYSLTYRTRLRLRAAVRRSGLSFLGVCAGAWIAVGAEADTGRVANYGLAVAKGPQLPLYLPEGPRRLAAIVDLKFPDGTKRSTVWWGSPATPEWREGVVARYASGEPAISQTRAGKGFVMVTGPHPEADTDWWTDSGTDPDGVDHDLTEKLIHATYHQLPLPVFRRN